jgi:cyclophilin family peptidyl-prolyl cis-trans isomerase/HEAT repeat protein
MNVRLLASVSACLALAACASAPVVVKPVAVSYEQKMAWILQLEDQRILKLPDPPAPPPPATTGRRTKTPPPPPPAESSPDLARLVTDGEARVRRRAAVAIGRVGLREGGAALTPALVDSDEQVRAAATFALGLLGDPASAAALTPLLTDSSALVRGRAAEALGSIGANDAADAIAKMAVEYSSMPAVLSKQPDDETWPAEPEAEAYKLAVFALVRLRAFDALSVAVLDPSGQPRTTWWPVAFALQRVDDPRAVPALKQLLNVPGRYTRAFAIRGLGRAKDPSAGPLLLPFLDATKQPREVVASAIAAVRELGVQEAAAPLGMLAEGPRVEPNLRLEAVATLGVLRAQSQLAIVQDLLSDEWEAMRAAALRAAAAIDQESFVRVLSGMEPDRQWKVRAALATVLGTLPAELALERVRSMLRDEDKRVVPSVLRSLAQLKAPDLETVLLTHLKDSDYVIRSTAADIIGDVKPAAGLAALKDAYAAGQADGAMDARAAAISAAADIGGPDATALVRSALQDKDWAVRVRAVELLAKLDPAANVQLEIRPAPGAPPVLYNDLELITPPSSPHAFIETAKGTIEFELSVLDAPQTSRNFMALARKGFFNGVPFHRVVPNFVIQDGDPRGDGQGGAGYTIRDELNDRPYLRGTVGMALSWKDTGGSQFFITHSPAPHLDGRYTVFGHVVNGMDVVDRIQVGDVIRQVRVWDGKSW